MQRCEVYFSGQVQGVGFRYSTLRIAQRFNVTGFVRNLPDGRVHLVLEGSANELDDVLRDLNREMGGYIRDTMIDRRSANGEFTSFEIRH